MIEVSDEEFQKLIDHALSMLPPEHVRHVQNVAILYEDEPTPKQREALKLQCNETLFGLYEGIPLTRRMGATNTMPDRITIFKRPISGSASTLPELQEAIRHTLWHEIAHYFGLDHDQIHQLEGRVG